MKKVLLASTALILTAGVAAADGHAGLSLSGSANAGLKYAEGAAEEITLHNEINMVITGVGVSDSGLEFGAFIELDEDTSNDGTDAASTSSDNNGVADAEVYIKGLFGTVTMGDIDPATDGFGIADVGFDGIGVDDQAEQFKNAAGAANIHYAYSASGLTFSASYDLAGTDTLAVAATYAAAAFSAGIGYVDNPDNGTNTITAVAGFSQGAFSVNALYSDWSGGGQGYGVDASFTTGATKITAAYGNASGASAGKGLGDSYGIGFSMPLGGGLAVAGGIGDIDGQTKADLGVTMKF